MLKSNSLTEQWEMQNKRTIKRKAKAPEEAPTNTQRLVNTVLSLFWKPQDEGKNSQIPHYST